MLIMGTYFNGNGSSGGDFWIDRSKWIISADTDHNSKRQWVAESLDGNMQISAIYPTWDQLCGILINGGK